MESRTPRVWMRFNTPTCFSHTDPSTHPKMSIVRWKQHNYDLREGILINFTCSPAQDAIQNVAMSLMMFADLARDRLLKSSLWLSNSMVFSTVEKSTLCSRSNQIPVRVCVDTKVQV